jgi:hypothetical protein
MLMKTYLLICLFAVIVPFSLSAQITTPVIRARFGVDGDLRSNYFNGLLQSGNDDWFMFPGTVGTGDFVIDTTGAAAIVSKYITQPATRRQPFFRTMRYPQFTVVNSRLLMDAVMVRDYHGDDSTVFASGSNKNGDNPDNWTTPVSQGIPDKNDILDMFVHVRRAGPTTADSLWMFGGLSLDNVQGNRYFDFEMYQTDIYYDRPSLQFYGYGPDAGHTSWQFDAAGNVTKPGDIIFSAEYQSSSLTFLEARIWVNKSALLMTPAEFSWSGQFDGASAGATYGYASILPKDVTGIYYTGLQCANNTWGGPFSIVLQNNSVVTNYVAKQFVEFSVNLTKLGLDPVTLLGGSVCGMPFRRILVKTRASASFTAELKDFVGPFDLFLAPRALALTETPTLCNADSTGHIYVTNAVPSSVYVWTTTDGHIISSPTGPSIYIDQPGTYIVTQYLQAGCSVYAMDTIKVMPGTNCNILEQNFVNFQGQVNNDDIVKLDWKVLDNQQIQYFEVQRSEDGVNFISIDNVPRQFKESTEASYSYNDDAGKLYSNFVYYRIRLVNINSGVYYSNVINIKLSSSTGQTRVNILPNPVRDIMQLQVLARNSKGIRVDFFDQSGRLVSSSKFEQKGRTIITLTDLANKPRGIYYALIYVDEQIFRQKILLAR